MKREEVEKIIKTFVEDPSDLRDTVDAILELYNEERKNMIKIKSDVHGTLYFNQVEADKLQSYFNNRDRKSKENSFNSVVFSREGTTDFRENNEYFKDK